MKSKERAELWMKAELDRFLDDYLDSADCPEYTALAEAAAEALGIEEELDDEQSFIWEAAIEAFTGREVNA